mmetsp:Transcript_50493/g.58950  ORF Transcript_50493/g.58950 Transcript_50493/m.58950 type:complete len:81 (-) Transcript_50493:65-307(-)
MLTNFNLNLVSLKSSFYIIDVQIRNYALTFLNPIIETLNSKYSKLFCISNSTNEKQQKSGRWLRCSSSKKCVFMDPIVFT